MWTHWRVPIEVILSGLAVRFRQASQATAMMAS
jgi:hypothetical protein